MPIAQLISPQALDLKKEQPGLVILDCRFALDHRPAQITFQVDKT